MWHITCLVSWNLIHPRPFSVVPVLLMPILPWRCSLSRTHTNTPTHMIDSRAGFRTQVITGGKQVSVRSRQRSRCSVELCARFDEPRHNVPLKASSPASTNWSPVLFIYRASQTSPEDSRHVLVRPVASLARTLGDIRFQDAILMSG